MEGYRSEAISLLIGLGAGFILGYWTHALTIVREAADRRRLFRTRIQEWKTLIEDATYLNLHTRHMDSLPDLRTQCRVIEEDVRWWRRSRFRAACQTYAAIPRTEIEPPPRSSHSDEETQKRRQHHQAAKARLLALLDRLARLTA
ncbi:MAG: hypothetical protein KF833_18555 [Verrucomicrobiae bacterium]|nr:hypothetical protein [Verrucomicrobiae bacterium]